MHISTAPGAMAWERRCVSVGQLCRCASIGMELPNSKPSARQRHARTSSILLPTKQVWMSLDTTERLLSHSFSPVMIGDAQKGCAGQ